MAPRNPKTEKASADQGTSSVPIRKSPIVLIGKRIIDDFRISKWVAPDLRKSMRLTKAQKSRSTAIDYFAIS